jgi:DNA-binding response OmpR family regulator
VVAGAGLRTSFKLSVLVVDDAEDILEYLQDVLGFEGFEVTTVGDPTFVVHKLRDEAFHLILLDVMMPKLTGLDLLAQIRALDGDMAVIVMDSAPSPETAALALSQGASAYMGQPIRPAELRVEIARIVEQKGLGLDREHLVHAAIGRQVHTLREARGLTLPQLARRTNLTVSLLSQIERAEANASMSSLRKVAAVLGVRLTDLFEGY